MYKFLASLAIMLFINGCSILITADNFVVQDDNVDTLKIEDLSKLINSDSLKKISPISLDLLDKTTLNGILFVQDNAIANVIYFPGNDVRINDGAKILLPQFLKLPVNLVWFDYRGMGISEGETTANTLESDSGEIIEFTTRSLPRELPLIIHGVSMGSLLAGYNANSKHINGIVLESPISSIDALVEQITPKWANLVFNFEVDSQLENLSNESNFSTFGKKLLILVGSEDDITPMSFSENIYDKVPSLHKELVIIERGGHGNLMMKEKTVLAYLDFLKLNI